MNINKSERAKIDTNIAELSTINWIITNDEKLNELFFEISDIFENKLKQDKKIRDWRMIEICFQHRALIDNDFEYPKTKNQCISMIADFLNQIN